MVFVLISLLAVLAVGYWTYIAGMSSMMDEPKSM